MPIPGEMLGGRYRLDDRIAAGGMGEVWRATDTALGRGVAVKTMHAERAADAGFETRFRHEARAMAVLHHPGVADVYDFGQTGDGTDAYIVMELVNGTALNQVIFDRGRLTATETMSIVAQAGRALNAAHQAGIVHRDVKPGNLIIQPDGTVMLVDFGVARSAESAALTGAREVIGTALYIAPEQVSKETTGPPADVYALGAVAYHCLSGHPPFEGENAIAVAIQHLQDEPPPLPPDVPPAVRAIVTTAMAKNPADRFPSAAAMAHAAERATAGVSLAATTALISALPPAHQTTPGNTAPGNTAVIPAVFPESEFEPAAAGGRTRALLTTAAAVLALGVAAAVLLALHLGLLPGGGTPETAVTQSTGASAPPSAGAGKGKAPAGTTHTTRASHSTSPTTAPTQRATVSPTQTAGDTPTETTAPNQPAPTTATTTAASGDGTGTTGTATGGTGGDSGTTDNEAAAPDPVEPTP